MASRVADFGSADSTTATWRRLSRTLPMQSSSAKGSVGFSPESSKSSLILISFVTFTQIGAQAEDKVMILTKYHHYRGLLLIGYFFYPTKVLTGCRSAWKIRGIIFLGNIPIQPPGNILLLRDYFQINFVTVISRILFTQLLLGKIL